MNPPPPLIQLVVAYAHDRVIGRDNGLPWRLPADLAHFKAATMGCPIIMGRKTWETLGRPLPGRLNNEVSRNTRLQAAGATVTASLPDALAAAGDAPRVCVIGGEQIFRAALPLAHEVLATEIHADIPGDTWFPAMAPDQWQETERLPQPEQNGLAFDFVTYRRR